MESSDRSPLQLAASFALLALGMACCWLYLAFVSAG